MASSLRVSVYERTASTTGTSGNVPLVTPITHGHIVHEAPALAHAARYPIILVLSLLILHKSFSSAQKWKTAAPREQYRRPTQVPYLTPMLGNAFSFLYAPQQLARSISERLGKSGIFSLNMLTQEVYVVSGSEYLNAIWKDTKKVMMSHDALNLSLSNMFGVPGKEMPFFLGDRTGSSHDPHASSPARDPDHRVSYLMLKTTADYLSGTHLTATAQKYQAAMKSQVHSLPIGDDWVEMDDLFSFTRRLIANSTVETMLGSSFLSQFPDFVDNFYKYNSRIRRFLQGWPRFLLPKAWCAPSDLGILWGTFSNAIILAFWLSWHTLQDEQLLSAATVEMDECRTKEASGSLSFDTTKLTSQPLLQSMHAEALRKYVAVYIPRTTEYGETQVLDYQIPKNKLLVINSAMAHMDERNWNLGTQGEYPVEKFWGERFLTRSTPSSAEADRIKSGSDEGKPRFSLNRYKGAWVPFGGGIHQCPARHWVKNQMLISLAVITGTFEIELRNKEKDLRIDLAKYGLGALNPGEQAPFRMRRKR